MTTFLPLLLFFISFNAQAFNRDAIDRDLKLILEKSPSKNIRIGEVRLSASKNIVKINCYETTLTIDVHATHKEQTSTFYYGLHKIGFLFPHPRIQVSPSPTQIKRHCGKSYQWQPRLKNRGFHLHTQHPSEWVAGFFMNRPQAAMDIVRWSARNMQNALQVQMIRVPIDELEKNFRDPLKLARDMQIQSGLSVSFALQQQKSYKLIPLFSSLTGIGDKKHLEKNLKLLLKSFAADFYTFELGTSEFTSTKYERTLKWLNLAEKILSEHGKSMFTKIHVSSNQHHPKWGNFNFLPEKAHKNVGVLPHTVMFYGLKDKKAPMYGQSNFTSILRFMLRNKGQRPTWYYPETSYYIALDIDMPLFLTDYIVARSRDMDLIEQHGIEGQVNFTTGQELGYWLMDWTVALLNIKEYRSQPTIALELLGERKETWAKIIQFQTKYFKEKQLIQILSSSNFQDETGVLDKIHERTLIRHLKGAPKILRQEISLLKEALTERPSVSEVKNTELQHLLQVTWNRIDHALHLRLAILNNNNPLKKRFHLNLAKAFRLLSLKRMKFLAKNFSRYSEVPIFGPFKNPTSYQYGYGWTAKNLFYWEREELIVKENRSNPFFMNILYNPIRLLL